MIQYGKNGKIKSTYMVSKLLFEQNVYLLDSDIRFLNYRHKIRDIHFAEGVKNDPDLCAHFSECIHTLGSLFYYLENDKSLQRDLSSMDSQIYPLIRHEDLTGITALLLFQKKLLEISDEGDLYYALDVAPRVYDSIKKPEEYFRNLLMALLRFNDEDTKNVRILIRRKKEEEKKEDGISVSFGDTDIKEALTERELNIRKNAENALLRIQKTMGNMIASNEEKKKVFREKEITFLENNQIRFNDISIMVPDGFEVRKEEDGTGFTFWIPNEENPHVCEASVFSFSVRLKPESAGDGMNLKPDEILIGEKTCQLNFKVSKMLENDARTENWKKQILQKFQDDLK